MLQLKQALSISRLASRAYGAGHAFLFFPCMSKRAADRPPRQRKRAKNGFSSRSQVLGLDPDPTEFMHIWHMNTEEPTMARKSSVPIPLQRPPSAEPLVHFEEGLDAMHVQPAVPARAKPKCRNDSVSHNVPTIPTAHSQRPSPDKNGCLDCPADNNIRRNYPSRRPSRQHGTTGLLTMSRGYRHLQVSRLCSSHPLLFTLHHPASRTLTIASN
jgi:hypothetical protein